MLSPVGDHILQEFSIAFCQSNLSTNNTVKTKSLKSHFTSQYHLPYQAFSLMLSILTINVPVVFMAQYVMVLRGVTSLRGALESVGPENRDIFGP